VSKDIESHKRSAFILYGFIETLKRLKLANPIMGYYSLASPIMGYYGRHREDDIVRMWQYGKKHGK